MKGPRAGILEAKRRREGAAEEGDTPTIGPVA
jgi:hypothetical protein